MHANFGMNTSNRRHGDAKTNGGFDSSLPIFDLARTALLKQMQVGTKTPALRNETLKEDDESTKIRQPRDVAVPP